MATSTGVSELRQQVDRLPATVTAQLRAVAWRKSREIKTRAQEILRSKTHGTGKTADSIVIHEEAAHKRFVVTVENPDNPNLGLWLERGTRKMAARPFMRPAADAIEPSYLKEMVAAAEQAVAPLGDF